MPVHRIRKRYVLFRWQKDDSLPGRLEFEKFLSSFSNKEDSREIKQFTRLVILDFQSQMGIVRTTHTLVSKLRSALVEAGERFNLPNFQVVAVSGTIKKLKQRLFSVNPSIRNNPMSNA